MVVTEISKSVLQENGENNILKIPVFTGNVKIKNIIIILDLLNKFIIYYLGIFMPSNKADIKNYVSRLTQYMSINYNKNKASVTSRNDWGKQEYKPEIRRGSRITFGNDYKLNHFIEPIMDIISEDLNKYNKIENFILDTTHCDLLFYQQGDKFKFHRDTIGKSPGKNYKFYTLLISFLDTESGGDTLIKIKDPENIIYFPESRQEFKYILFPSEEYHACSEILKGNKLCFKIDIWIKFKKSYSNDTLTMGLFQKKLFKYEPNLVLMIEKMVRGMVFKKTLDSIPDIICFLQNPQYTREEIFKLFIPRSYDIWYRRIGYYYEDNYDEDDRWCNGYDY